jgi:hypothetical protein
MKNAFDWRGPSEVTKALKQGETKSKNATSRVKLDEKRQFTVYTKAKPSVFRVE